MDNTITEVANEWLLQRANGTHHEANPFYNDGDELYLKYDSIRIKNLSNADGVGVEVGYYWKGVKMVIFPVENVRLDFLTHQNASNHIGLDGISGSMRMVVL